LRKGKLRLPAALLGILSVQPPLPRFILPTYHMVLVAGI
jgi:hypothetical protein